MLFTNTYSLSVLYLRKFFYYNNGTTVNGIKPVGQMYPVTPSVGAFSLAPIIQIYPASQSPVQILRPSRSQYLPLGHFVQSEAVRRCVAAPYVPKTKMPKSIHELYWRIQVKNLPSTDFVLTFFCCTKIWTTQHSIQDLTLGNLRNRANYLIRHDFC